MTDWQRRKTKSKRAAVPSETPELGLDVPNPGRSAQAPISISELTATIRELLEAEIGEVWVAGEISNFRDPGSGHLYFTLKDASATLAAVMFSREARRIGFALRDGQAVIARGTITVYEARGQYQMQVLELRPRGLGGLQQQFEELKRRLAAEQLFALERKRALPVFPEMIGIVTSLQGAVLQDMLQILQRRAPGIRVQVRGVRVQGYGAAQEIAEAIQAFSVEGQVDLVVIARGGGSLEDLWAFNEEAVARAMAACALPTISAVGHETDFTIADFVADVRAPTPSAAAEMLTRDWGEWRELITKLQARMERTTRQEIARRRRILAGLASSYALREPARIIHQQAQRIDDLRENLEARAGQRVENFRHRVRLLESRLAAHHPARELGRRRQLLAHLVARISVHPARLIEKHQAHLRQLAARLLALGPQATLDRGYALVLDAKTGRPLREAAQARVKDSLRVVLHRGALEVQVKTVTPDGERFGPPPSERAGSEPPASMAKRKRTRAS